VFNKSKIQSESNSQQSLAAKGVVIGCVQ